MTLKRFNREINVLMFIKVSRDTEILKKREILVKNFITTLNVMSAYTDTVSENMNRRKN